MPENLIETVARYTKDLERNSGSFNQVINDSNVSTQNVDQNVDNSVINNSQESENKPPLTNFFKYYLFCFFVIMYFFYGASESFLGPALSDLAKLYKTDAEHISYVFSFRNLVYCFSTIFVSFAFKFFGNRQMQYCFGLLLLGSTCGLTPFLKSFEQFVVVYFFSGLACAYMDSITSLVILEIFSLNSKVYVQTAFASYTIGAVFGPLLIGPFLSKEIPSDETSFKSFNTRNSLNFLINSVSETKIENTETESNIKVPYLIISSILIFGSIFFTISQIIHPYIPEKRVLVAKNKVIKKMQTPINQSDDTINNSESIASNSISKPETTYQTINLPKSYYFVFLGLGGLMISVYNCLETTTFLFIPSYLSNGDLKIIKKDAAFMASILYMSAASGRVITALLAFKLTCKKMLFFNTTLVLIGNIILTFFARSSKTLTWINMFILGFGFSSTYPLIFSFIENRVVISNNVQLYLLFSSGIFILFVPIIIGHYINTIPMMFTYISLTLAIATFIIMISIHFVDVWKKKLIKKIKEDQESLT